uniref:Uncharacterized protein n=1 Tax=Anguilla anguilla TaxID=7936 RepID=A0A0E9RGX5_ANGAN
MLKKRVQVWLWLAWMQKKRLIVLVGYFYMKRLVSMKIKFGVLKLSIMSLQLGLR